MQAFLITVWLTDQLVPPSSLLPPADPLMQPADLLLLYLASCWPPPAGLRNHQANLPHSSYRHSAPMALQLDLGNLDCCMAFGNCSRGLPMIGWGGSSNLDCKCWNKVSAAPYTLLPPQK